MTETGPEEESRTLSYEAPHARAPMWLRLGPVLAWGSLLLALSAPVFTQIPDRKGLFKRDLIAFKLVLAASVVCAVAALSGIPKWGSANVDTRAVLGLAFVGLLLLCSYGHP